MNIPDLSQAPFILTDEPTPSLYKEQLDLFLSQDIHTEIAGNFDVAAADHTLKTSEGTVVLAADFGGDKGTVRSFTVKDGSLVISDHYSDDIQGNDGANYLATIQKAAQYAESNGLAMGISWGGPITDNKIEFHPKATIFIKELEPFAGDMRQISPAITVVMNDAPAGLLSGAVQAFEQYKADTTLFAINGGGLGLSALVNGQVVATEAGHIQAIDALNTYNQAEACGVYGANFVCIERLGANKAGIEAQWQAQTGSYMRARDIEDRYKAGDRLAGELYEHSAQVVAHMVQGSAQALKINPSATTTAVVCHGGAFKFPHYGDRVAQILETANESRVQLLMTKDFAIEGSNTCLDGIAIATLTSFGSNRE